MEERITESLGSRRFVVILLAFFAGMALFMAALGLYGLISFIVTQRTHEIGIRMAMGAHRVQVLAFVIGQGMRILLVGLVIGIAGAHILARIFSNQLFQVGAFDPVTFALMALLLTAVALLASFIPAQRATKVDPLEACRYE